MDEPWRVQPWLPDRHASTQWEQVVSTQVQPCQTVDMQANVRAIGKGLVVGTDNGAKSIVAGVRCRKQVLGYTRHSGRVGGVVGSEHDDNNSVMNTLVFSREMLDNEPRHDHDCGLPHVDERCPREVMVKLLRPNSGDDLFAKYNQANRQAIHDHFRLSPNLLQGPTDWNIATTREVLDVYRTRMLGDGYIVKHCDNESVATAHGAVNAPTSSDASTAITITKHAVKATPAPNTVVLDAEYEALLESGVECQVTIVHPEVLAAYADVMGDVISNANAGIQCFEHDLFTDDDGVQRCVFCMATQEEIDAYEAMMQAQAYEATYGSCECCGAFDDDVHDANCPRRPCTEEEDAAHESRFDDPGRYDDDFDPDYPDDDNVVIEPPSEPEDGCDE